ncbi:hypothetical protein AB1Y20_003677 [Prymnesium parvum]|uniref:Uncharacterized protein n=1 Tax=Prymnesium parvum TaxID=97485 RepID=A0AB34J4J9_PRYPA
MHCSCSVPVSAMPPLPVCNQSPTLMRRWASGTAPAVFKQASSVRYNCRLKKQQAAVDHALADEMQGKLLSPHSMPPELFGIQTAGVDLVEDGVRRTFHKMCAALESELSCIQ